MPVGGTGPEQITSVPNAPIRRMTEADKALMATPKWSHISPFLLEDPVSLADEKAIALQGVVAFVGRVHFADGFWVGIQLTGPSVGKGNCDGSIRGKRYFPNVGRRNGVFAPIYEVQKRVKAKTGDPMVDARQEQRRTARAQMADVNFVETLKEERTLAILKRNEEKRRFLKFENEQMYVQRLKQERLDELRRSRNEPLQPSIITKRAPKPKFGGNRPLENHDFEFVKSLEMTQQNFCLSDPTLPDNPVVFASQAFLNMSGYNLSEILGRNCRFLQGPKTEKRSVNRLRQAIREGSDCSVCLLNYRANGTPFFNHCFLTALRDERGRIKNYIGVQCEVSQQFAMDFNQREMERLRAESERVRMHNSTNMARAKQGGTRTTHRQVQASQNSSMSSSVNSSQYMHRSMDSQSSNDHRSRPSPSSTQVRHSSPQLSWNSDNTPPLIGSENTAPLTPSSNEDISGMVTPQISNYSVAQLEAAFARAARVGVPVSTPREQAPHTTPSQRQEPHSLNSNFPLPQEAFDFGENMHTEQTTHTTVQTTQYEQEMIQSLRSPQQPFQSYHLTPKPKSTAPPPPFDVESYHHTTPKSKFPAPPLDVEFLPEEPDTEIVPAHDFRPVSLEARTYEDATGQLSLTQLEVGDDDAMKQRRKKKTERRRKKKKRGQGSSGDISNAFESLE